MIPAGQMLHALAAASTLAFADGQEYKLVEKYVGPHFFDRWDWYDGGDPTHGTVDFVNAQEAFQDKLAWASAQRVYMGVDNTSILPPGQGRKAIKLLSKTIYNSGLFIMTAENVPAACGAWPAWWMFGEDSQHAWPRWGEYDILESVHNLDFSTTTLHTKENCDESPVNVGIDFEGQGWAKGSIGNKAKNCWVNAPNEFNNQGCGQQMPHGSFGPGMNKKGGGTWAAEWDPVGHYLRTWFWPAGQEPQDIIERRANPEFWGTPNSFFTLDRRFCSKDHFKNMKMVFDTTFCGDYASPSFAGACPEIHTSCDAFVRGNPAAMSSAFWMVSRLDVYNRLGEEPTTHEVVSSDAGSSGSSGASQSAGLAGLFSGFSGISVSVDPHWFLLSLRFVGIMLCIGALCYAYHFLYRGGRRSGEKCIKDACDGEVRRESRELAQGSLSPSNRSKRQLFAGGDEQQQADSPPGS